MHGRRSIRRLLTAPFSTGSIFSAARSRASQHDWIQTILRACSTPAKCNYSRIEPSALGTRAGRYHRSAFLLGSSIGILFQMESDIKDKTLAAEGAKRIEWAARDMPGLLQVRERFRKEQPLKGKRVGACLHVTVETANLMITLKEAGADVALCASNPLSSQDEAAAGLVGNNGTPEFAFPAENHNPFSNP